MLRKWRLQGLRVRNEELMQLANQGDQKWAKAIQQKFETDTHELRLKRLEDRLELLAKLDQKRIQFMATSNDACT